MRLQLSSDSRVTIELRATGLLRALAHDPALTVAPEALALDVPETEALDVPVAAVFFVDRIEPPSGMDRSDRDKMRDNLRGAEVLDAVRYPRVELRARYVGTREGGRLQGELLVRGNPRPLSMDVRTAREGDKLVARGAWQGRLTELGVKPFKALLGAIKLDDWVRLRVEAGFEEAR